MPETPLQRVHSGGTALKTSGGTPRNTENSGPEEAFKLTRQGQAVNLLVIVKLCLPAVNRKNLGRRRQTRESGQTAYYKPLSLGIMATHRDGAQGKLRVKPRRHGQARREGGHTLIAPARDEQELFIRLAV